MLCLHCPQYAGTLDRGMNKRLVQLDFSAAFHRVSHCDLLYKLRSISGLLFLSIASKFLRVLTP